MSKHATQTKINLADGIVQAEENIMHDNSLLPMADELERLVSIDKSILQWILKRAEIEQDSRIEFSRSIVCKGEEHLPSILLH